MREPEDFSDAGDEGEDELDGQMLAHAAIDLGDDDDEGDSGDCDAPRLQRPEVAPEAVVDVFAVDIRKLLLLSSHQPA